MEPKPERSTRRRRDDTVAQDHGRTAHRQARRLFRYGLHAGQHQTFDTSLVVIVKGMLDQDQLHARQATGQQQRYEKNPAIQSL